MDWQHVLATAILFFAAQELFLSAGHEIDENKAGSHLMTQFLEGAILAAPVTWAILVWLK